MEHFYDSLLVYSALQQVSQPHSCSGLLPVSRKNVELDPLEPNKRWVKCATLCAYVDLADEIVIDKEVSEQEPS